MKIKLQLITLSLICLTSGALKAQEVELTETEKLEQRTQALESAVKKLQKLKISGYIQAQYQWGEEDASLKVGDGNNEKSKESFDRLGIRRGRIKFSYEEGIASGVFQLDITEKGVGFKDAYLQVKDPFFGTNSFKAGIFDRPFGYEISYSSSRRESPERSMIFQTLFPDERDLGVMLTLQPFKNSPLNFLKLEAGLFAGNGIKTETDSRKDFIGHLSANKKLNSNITLSGGFSYYNGGVYQGTNNVCTMDGKYFVLNNNADNLGKSAKREYFGIDAQLGVKTIAGATQINAEYLFGQQPGTETSSKSPNSATLLTTDTYIRDFSGGYAMLVQDLGKLPFSAVLKYDWYDPNCKISGDEVGVRQTATTKTDLSFNTFGFGLLWHIDTSLRLTAYYEMVNNETSENVTGWEKNRKDDVFTLRLQYKF